MYRPSERQRAYRRERSRSPTRHASQHARFGSDAPAARYFSSRPLRHDSAPPSDEEGDDEDGDGVGSVASRRRGPVSPRRRRSDYGAPEYYRTTEVPITRVEGREEVDFAVKVAAFKLPGSSADEQFESIDHLVNRVEDEGIQRALAEPSNAINVYRSQYVGDGVSEGMHSASLTVRHDVKGKACSLFRWLHVKQDVMSLEGFSDHIMRLPALPASHRTAISRLLFEVKKSYSKPVWTSKNATVRHMAPSFHQVPIRSERLANKESRTNQDYATWFSMPYLELKEYSGLEASADPATYPTPTMLQSSYARISRKRDMSQVVRQVGVGSNTSCYHIPQLWSVVVGESLLLTCGIMSEEELRGERDADAGKIPTQKAVSIVSEPPMESKAKDNLDARILVCQGDTVLWAFQARDCPTFFGFIARFRDFWPRVPVFRYHGQVVSSETWEKGVLHDIRTHKKDVVIAMEVSTATDDSTDGTQLEDEAFVVRHVAPRSPSADKTRQKEPQEDKASGSDHPPATTAIPYQGQFHVFSWLQSRKHSPASIREGIQESMAEIDSFFSSAANSPWNQNYARAESSLQSDIFGFLKRVKDQTFGRGDDSDMIDGVNLDTKIELYNAAKTLHRFFLPPNSVSKVSSKYWGAISNLLSVNEENETDARQYSRRRTDEHVNAGAVLAIFRRHTAQLAAFDKLLNECAETDKAAIRIPGDLVQAWILLVMGLIRASADYYDWEDQLAKAMDKIRAGMSSIVASLPGPGLGSSALVLPLDLLSLMLPGLLSDSSAHRPGYSQVYSDYLQGLETEIMGMKSDISYQNRINLAQQEISVIRNIIESQKSVLRQLLLAQSEQHTWKAEVAITTVEPATRTGRRHVETRNVYDDSHRDDPAQQEYKAWSRVSPVDPRGLRTLLLRDCVSLLRGAAQDFEEYEFQAGSLEQMNMNKVSVTKDRQEQLLYAFTVVTIIFLPMDTVSSIFGMNTADVRDMELTQWAFWAAAIPTGIAVILAALWMVGAYSELAAWLGKKFRGRSELVLEDQPPPYQRVVGEGIFGGRHDGGGEPRHIAVQPRVYARYSDEWDEPTIYREGERVTRRAGYRVVER